MRKWMMLAAFAGMTMTAANAQAAEIKVFSAGAYKSVMVALLPNFEKQSGHKVVIEDDAVGPLVRRIERGDAFDLAIVTPAAVAELEKKGRVAPGSTTRLARVGIGVVVKEGAPKPDISTVEAFKNAVLAAKSVAYIDPAYGGSSGIFVDGLLKRLGIADQVKPKARLRQGGYLSEWVAAGEVELGIHQISEILPVKGAALVGPLPPEIQNYTVYAAGISAQAKEPEAAKALIKALTGPEAAQVLKSKGMEPPA